MIDQPIETAGDRAFIRTVRGVVRLAGRQERQERHGRGTDVGIAGPAAAAARFALAVSRKAFETPAAVVEVLMASEPVERTGHSPFAGLGAAVAADHRAPRVLVAAGIEARAAATAASRARVARSGQARAAHERSRSERLDGELVEPADAAAGRRAGAAAAQHRVGRFAQGLIGVDLGCVNETKGLGIQFAGVERRVADLEMIELGRGDFGVELGLE